MTRNLNLEAKAKHFPYRVVKSLELKSRLCELWPGTASFGGFLQMSEFEDSCALLLNLEVQDQIL
jgi:hypothetical protein